MENREKKVLNKVECECDLDNLDFDIVLKNSEGKDFPLANDSKIAPAGYKAYEITEWETIYAYAIPTHSSHMRGYVVANLCRDTERTLGKYWNWNPEDATFFSRYITPDRKMLMRSETIDVGGKRVKIYAKFSYRCEEFRLKKYCNCLLMISMKRSCKHDQHRMKVCFIRLIIHDQLDSFWDVDGDDK
jgi:hypothetical protein